MTGDLAPIPIGIISTNCCVRQFDTFYTRLVIKRQVKHFSVSHCCQVHLLELEEICNFGVADRDDTFPSILSGETQPIND